MILILHIAIALSSLAFAAYVYVSPSRAKLNGTYVLTALTVASGTWLVAANPAHMVQACMSGLAFLAIMFLGIALARHKLAVSDREL
jgi:hypothetical protein